MLQIINQYYSDYQSIIIIYQKIIWKIILYPLFSTLFQFVNQELMLGMGKLMQKISMLGEGNGTACADVSQL
jgi:hypothetical protein